MTSTTVTILMATYNGSKYIKNQILSLQQQKYDDWILLVHDDGSTDSTIDEIEKLAKYDRRIKLICDGISRLGPGKNFMSMLKYAESDYIIFCDQDDIWLENKLSVMLTYAEEKKLGDSELPSIVYADGYAFCSESGDIHFDGISNNHADSLNDFLFFNGGYQGCSILFNKAMLNILKDYLGYIHLHDDIVSLVAHSLGKVYFLPEKLMLYRQHENAVTGSKVFKKAIFPLLNSKVNYLLSKEHYLVKKSFYDNYHHLFSKDINESYNNFFDFAESKKKTEQFKILIKGNYRLNNSKTKLLIKFLIRRTFNQ